MIGPAPYARRFIFTGADASAITQTIPIQAVASSMDTTALGECFGPRSRLTVVRVASSSSRRKMRFEKQGFFSPSSRSARSNSKIPAAMIANSGDGNGKPRSTTTFSQLTGRPPATIKRDLGCNAVASAGKGGGRPKYAHRANTFSCRVCRSRRRGA